MRNLRSYEEKEMRRQWTRKGLKFLLIASVAIGVLSFLVMSLWNWLMPPLFGRPLVTYWQALGLLVLSRVLLGGLRGRPGPPHWHWRKRMMERWEQMTPEEREMFRQGLKGSRPSGP
jgi:hypothetical protein